MMSESLTIDLTDDLKAQIDALSSADGVSAADWVRRAIEAHVFIRRFRSVREEMLRSLDERGIQLTDEDVFKMVS
jgi:predicted transcriptional regulator